MPDAKAVPAIRAEENPDVLLQVAMAQLQRARDSDGAALTYRRVVQLDPRNEIAWYNLGVIAQQKGDTAGALKAYDKALKIAPEHPWALYNKALLLKSHEPERAVGLLRRAIAADPNAASPHLHLGHILAQKDRDHEAEEEFRRAVTADASLLDQVPERYQDLVSPSSTSSRAGSTR